MSGALHLLMAVATQAKDIRAFLRRKTAQGRCFDCRGWAQAQGSPDNA
jgi:hypothetical protein